MSQKLIWRSPHLYEGRHHFSTLQMKKQIKGDNSLKLTGLEVVELGPGVACALTSVGRTHVCLSLLFPVGKDHEGQHGGELRTTFCLWEGRGPPPLREVAQEVSRALGKYRPGVTN